MKKISGIIILISIAVYLITGCQQKVTNDQSSTGNVVFVHPDGSGLAMWDALRLLKVGPDGLLNWDKMDHLGTYRGHLINSASSSSNGGGTVHAFGVKANYDDYGNNPDKPFKSLSGKEYSIMTEAQKQGKSVAIINSGHICEPGTGVYLANSFARNLQDTISAQIINSGADIIFTGGEVYLLPEGKLGYHGESGVRKDNRNLLNEAEALGYKVVLSRDELLNLSSETDKVLGIFAAENSFNDLEEEKLKQLGLPNYNVNAPTLAEMTEVALRILNAKNRDFFIVIEEEGSDNFSNYNNANGALEALSRADDAIGVAMNFIDSNPNTLLITAADSDAGSMQVLGIRKPNDFDKPLPMTANNGAPMDGVEGTGTLPFVSKSDQFGNNLRFAICWALSKDGMGGIVAKSHGLNSESLPNNVDNTDIYKVIYKTLFGIDLE
ncbi:MAG: alkaline phosphatase [Candidatus Neomarinimicrobiota bacterium]